jgi:hypothetical protein
MENEEKQTIKELYDGMLEVAEANHPEFYIMPKSFYNRIIDKIQYLERALKNAQKSRDNWRKKYEDEMK